MNSETPGSGAPLGGERLDRRALLSAGLTGGLAAIVGAGAVGYYARERAPFQPKLERITATLPAAHADLAGLRIGFIADTHLGPVMTEADVARAIALIADDRPDLVLLGGDYISASPRFAEPIADLLSVVVASSRFGAVAVLGNHDCGEKGRAEIVTEALVAQGITVLRNGATMIDTGSGELWIAGTDEAIMARADPARTFARIPSDAAVISLWHEPDYADEIARTSAFMQLSGHSHGGQVRLPMLGPMFLPKGGERYVIGWNEARGLPVYTSRGVGVFQPPVRINCPPEVTMISLVAPQ